MARRELLIGHPRDRLYLWCVAAFHPCCISVTFVVELHWAMTVSRKHATLCQIVRGMPSNDVEDVGQSGAESSRRSNPCSDVAASRGVATGTLFCCYDRHRD